MKCVPRSTVTGPGAAGRLCTSWKHDPASAAILQRSAQGAWGVGAACPAALPHRPPFLSLSGCSADLKLRWKYKSRSPERPHFPDQASETSPSHPHLVGGTPTVFFQHLSLNPFSFSLAYTGKRSCMWLWQIRKKGNGKAGHLHLTCHKREGWSETRMRCSPEPRETLWPRGSGLGI